MPTIKEIIKALFNEIKAILGEYLNEAEAALKKRLKKLIITSIIVSVLTTLVILFIGSSTLSGIGKQQWNTTKPEIFCMSCKF